MTDDVPIPKLKISDFEVLNTENYHYTKTRVSGRSDRFGVHIDSVSTNHECCTYYLKSRKYK